MRLREPLSGEGRRFPARSETISYIRPRQLPTCAQATSSCARGKLLSEAGTRVSRTLIPVREERPVVRNAGESPAATSIPSPSRQLPTTSAMGRGRTNDKGRKRISPGPRVQGRQHLAPILWPCRQPPACTALPTRPPPASPRSASARPWNPGRVAVDHVLEHVDRDPAQAPLPRAPSRPSVTAVRGSFSEA